MVLHTGMLVCMYIVCNKHDDMYVYSYPYIWLGTTSKAPGHQSAGVVTTGAHPVTASSNNKTTPYGSHSLATSKDNKNTYQPTGIIKSSVREDHMSNRIDQSNTSVCSYIYVSMCVCIVSVMYMCAYT